VNLVVKFILSALFAPQEDELARFSKVLEDIHTMEEIVGVSSELS